MVFFLDEVLFKTIREVESNMPLFEFIFDSIKWLDGPQAAGKDFHLLFLMQLSRYLGFHPTQNYTSENNIFNLREGKFQETYPDHPNYISPALEECVKYHHSNTHHYRHQFYPAQCIWFIIKHHVTNRYCSCHWCYR